MSCGRQFLAFIFVSEEAVTQLAQGHIGQFQGQSWMPDLLGLAPRASPTSQQSGAAGQKSGSNSLWESEPAKTHEANQFRVRCYLPPSQTTCPTLWTHFATLGVLRSMVCLCAFVEVNT